MSDIAVNALADAAFLDVPGRTAKRLLELAGDADDFLSPLTQEERTRARELRAAAFGSEDAKEGRAAFLEKRPPRFQGR